MSREVGESPYSSSDRVPKFLPQLSSGIFNLSSPHSILRPSAYVVPIFVHLNVGNVPFRAFLDTGSDFSLVSVEFSHRLQYHQPSPLSLWSVNSQVVVVQGMCLLQ